MSAHEFVARVRGSDPCDVRLQLGGGGRKRIAAACTCPAFRASGPCKHVWAAILSAESEGWAADAARSQIEIQVDDASKDGVTYEYDDDVSARPGWRDVLDEVVRGSSERRPAPIGQKRTELWYGLHLQSTKERGELTIELFQRELRASGDWGVLKPCRLDRNEIAAQKDPVDRKILGTLFGAEGDTGALSFNWSYRRDYGRARYGVFGVPGLLLRPVLKELRKTGRFALIEVAAERPNEEPLFYDDEAAWRFEAALKRDPTDRESWLLEGRLSRGGEVMPLSAPKVIVADGLVVFADRVAPLVPLSKEERRWAEHLRTHGATEIPKAELDAFMSAAERSGAFPPIVWPEDTGWAVVKQMPTPRLSILSKPQGKSIVHLDATVSFDYEGRSFRRHDVASTWIDKERRRINQRDVGAERERFGRLEAVSAKITPADDELADVTFPSALIGELTEALTAEGWVVEAEGHRVFTPASVTVSIASGIDWFDLDGGFTFNGHAVGMPEILSALRRSERFVRLGDGTLGMLPSRWIEQFAVIAELGATYNKAVRYSRSQAALLDALVSELPEIRTDLDFEALRAKMKAFDGIEPVDAAPGFQGRLRDYQREGLGWLRFVQDFGFGGCLADDMGLGKTVQVLALLHGNPRGKPSLIVVPRSLVSNWKSEAQRFCPDLKVLDLSQGDRQRSWDAVATSDLVITTYGVLRRDVEKLAAIRFEYAILDEAQAIKNAASQVAKASRLLQARHRLALTGTPVENHLVELGSLFEFLNPGMLPPALMEGIAKSDPEKGHRSTKLFAKALRPFILRRTKEQVLKDLPDKTEQTIVCELEPAHRELYDQVRAHYRLQLSEAADAAGVQSVEVRILEALLRLRQIACHPGLVDAARADESSAKLDALIDTLQSVIESGHKALVFSQFTSMLDIVRRRLERHGLRYEYLDGRTRDRQAAVDAFQTDASIPVFLISLKAGGVGLNLTAADYCFILDPWWNPAVEAQAVARAHRIGQANHVFAYRLIAKDTVEEKILALQERKKTLADSILLEEASLGQRLTLEDMRLLLS